MATKLGEPLNPEWVQQYGSSRGGALASPMHEDPELESPMHEDPELEKVRQALASLGIATSSASAANKGSDDGQSNAQNLYNGYTSPGQYGMSGSYQTQASQQTQAAGQHQGNITQPPVPGLEDSMSYSTMQSQVSSSGNQPASPQIASHSLSQAGPSGSQHSNTNANSYTQQHHNYDSSKQKKGQLWNRMKQSPGAGGLKFNIQKRPMVMTNQNFASNDQHNDNSVQQPTRMHHHMLQQQTEKSQDHCGNSAKPEDWLPSMKEDVQRCFTACESEKDEDRTEKRLKEVLQARLQDGSAFTIDWSREPLPGNGQNFKNKRKRKKKVKMVFEDPDEDFKKEMRAARYHLGHSPKKRHLEPLVLQINQDPNDSNNLDRHELTIVGSSQDIAKQYLRLTRAPDPPNVRPVTRDLFNQCQAPLKALYAGELTVYHILYYIFTKNSRDLTTEMVHLTKEMKKDPCVALALSLRSVWTLSHYFWYFMLYKAAPLMSGYLIDQFAERERKEDLKTMIKTFRPMLPTSYIESQLAFESEEE